MTRVAIDARRLQDRPLGGVGRMLANLVPLVSTAVEVVLLTDGRRPPVGGPWRQVALSLPARLPEPVWLQLSVPRWLRGFDGVFHGTFNALPVRTAAARVVTFHDVSFERHPEDFRPDKRLVWRLQARHAARVARVVTTTTAFVRDALVQALDIDASRIVLTPPAVDPVFDPARADEAPSVLAPRGVEGPYVVALGGARRRGLPVAVAAWERVRAGGWDWPLVVVGPESVGPRPGVIGLGPLDDASWAAVLAGAEAFCYPTRYEGFGMPALESAASGTPVVCARIGALTEVLGDAAEWCEDPGVDAISAGLQRLLADPDRGRALRAAGLSRAGSAPTWAESAAALVGAYERAAQR